MAGDGIVVTASDMIVETHVSKIVRLKDGRILGVAGRRSDLVVLAEWLEAGMPMERPKFDSDAVVIGPDGAFYIDERLHPLPSAVPTALGSGRRHALTAMDMGASPKTAVEMAARRDPFTGGSITVETLAPQLRAGAA